MTCVIASVKCGGPGPILPKNPEGVNTFLYHNEDNSVSPCRAYQDILENTKEDIIIYVHDDLEVYEPQWCEAFINLFERGYDDIVSVGLGGATSLGHPDLYKKRYCIESMARGAYYSNQVGAETHGTRWSGEKRVAVLDAFCMAVRRDFLVSVGGWPVHHLTHHCLDLWLACEAAKHEKQIWMMGYKCNHYGGGTSVGENYAKAGWLQGGTRESDHGLPHLWLYKTYPQVLPIKV